MSLNFITRGSGAPSSTPVRSGFLYVDETNNDVYLSTDTNSSADWRAVPDVTSFLSIDADMDFGGAYKAINLKGLDFQTFAESTIASGVIAPTQTLVSVDNEGDASADDIDTITVATDLNMICLKMENASRVPTLKHGTGNLSLPNGSDVAMVNDLLYWFIYDGSNWLLSFDPAGTAATFPVADGTTLLQGSIDSTKKVRFEVDTNTPTATTRVISTPSVDLDMDDIVINSGTGTDNAIPRFNADGQTVQDSNVLIDDSDNLSGVAKISTTDHLELTEIAAPSTPAMGKVAVYTKTDGKLYIKDDAGTETDCTGDVVGPASSTDNAIARFDSTTGKLIQNSSVTVDDNGKIDTGTEVAIGGSAGATSQGSYSIAVGESSGLSSQGNNSVAIGREAGNTTQGSQSVAIGYFCGRTTQSNEAVAIGREAGKISQGSNTVAIGREAGESSQGSQAIAIGRQAGETSQTSNTIAIGYQAGQSSFGSNCTAIGYRALTATTGSNNTAVGYDAGRLITTGQQNVALGTSALDANVSSNANTAVGYASLSECTGSANTAFGGLSLFTLTSGSNNTAVGYQAGRYISGGVTANQTSGTSCYIGRDTKASADGNSNEIVIGYNTTGNGSNTVTLGNTSITETHIQGALAIDDGITAPSTITGKASIYVDSSDGDLKIKYSDGTIKTIVVDT